jgi:SAM-dependent methyltransferase
MDPRRTYLARAYARALARAQTADDSRPHEGGAPASRFPGYRLGDVAFLPEQARNSSFGCGNPLAFAVLREGEVVLDVGCGAGVDLLIAARRVGPAGLVLGLDLTLEMLSQAAANAAAAGLSNVRVCQGVMEELPVRGSTVDWVVSNGAIGLSTDKGRAFREIRRALRRGGRMVVADITAEGLPSWVRDSPSLAASCLAGAMSEEALLEATRAAGLADPALEQRIVLEPHEVAAILEAELRAYREATGDSGLRGLSGNSVPLPQWAVASTTMSAVKPA